MKLLPENFDAALTAKGVVEQGLQFSVPVYQRLFVWGEEQIMRLLNDLWESIPRVPYYVGTISVHSGEDDRLELVDGQQRLTFLTLFGAWCMSNCAELAETWAKFVFMDQGESREHLRVHYVGREEDEDCILRIARNEAGKLGKNFQTFVDCANRFLQERQTQVEQFDLTKYGLSVFENLSFLIDVLPQKFGPRELNSYFEKMNSTGRQLEPIDVLKGLYFSDVAEGWNRLVSADFGDNATISSLSQLFDGEFVEAISNEVANEDRQKRDGDGDTSHKKLIIKSDVLLLHALSLFKNDPSLSLDPDRLLQTFDEAGFCEKDASKFLEVLEKYRMWIVNNIIYLREMANGDTEYLLSDEEDDNSPQEHSGDRKRLRQFEAMLYVSSDERQRWILDAYREMLRVGPTKVLSLDMLKRLDKDSVKKRGAIVDQYYPAIDRYWFWKLDYLLWEKFTSNERDDIWHDLFDGVSSANEKLAIETYVFRRNRSVEHLYPQHPVSENLTGADQKWKDAGHDALHGFGNLAMISSSFNSTQQNDSLGVKFARMTEEQVLLPRRLESIKMLLMFREADGRRENWLPDVANQHLKKMVKLLKEENV